MGKKRIRRKKYSAKKNRSTGILPILFIVALLALFSETVRTIPVGAFSDNFSNITYEVPRLNSALLENKLIQNNNKIKYKATKEEIIIKTLKEYKITSFSDRKNIGIWVNHKNKIKTGKYFMEKVMPELFMYSKKVQAGKSSMMDMDVAEF